MRGRTSLQRATVEVVPVLQPLFIISICFISSCKLVCQEALGTSDHFKSSDIERMQIEYLNNSFTDKELVTIFVIWEICLVKKGQD